MFGEMEFPSVVFDLTTQPRMEHRGYLEYVAVYHFPVAAPIVQFCVVQAKS